MNEQSFHIGELIKKHLADTLSSQEQTELQAWIDQDRANAVFFDRILSSDITKDIAEISTLDVSAVAERLQEIYPSIHADPVSPELDKPVSRAAGKVLHRVHFLSIAWWKYAAAILLIFCIGIAAYLYSGRSDKDHQLAMTSSVPESDIKPGTNKAVLTLADGSVIKLDSAANGQLAMQSGSAVIKKDGRIIYDARSIEVNKETYNTMSTPAGGQYQLSLPDGTRVWLNALSSITYPVAFIGKTRSVRISGEAYFEVMQNKAKPFIVQAAGDQLTVLGTAFNINAYADEGSAKTSLVQGSVKINDKILKPGQAYIDGNIIQTDMDHDLAWRNGFFSFDKADIRTVMRQLSRWYDIEVEYRGEIPEARINGKLGRSLTLQQLLRGLAYLRINYTLDNKKLVIQK